MLYCLYILQCIKNLCKKHGEEKEETAQKMDKATIQKQEYKKAAAVIWRMKSAGVKVQSWDSLSLNSGSLATTSSRDQLYKPGIRKSHGR